MTSPETHLGEALHVVFDNFRVRTFELLDDVKALTELCEDVGDRTGEESVLRRLLEL